MNRKLIAFTALAATFALAAPAFAEQSVRVKIAGKSTSDVYVAIAKAAHTVCRAETGSDIYNIYSAADCEKSTIAETIKKVGDPALAQYALNRAVLLMQVASN